jgi:hypothetical protein
MLILPSTPCLEIKGAWIFSIAKKHQIRRNRTCLKQRSFTFGSLFPAA